MVKNFETGAANGAWVKKDKKPLSMDEFSVKLRRTIGWYNKNGDLQQPISYKDVIGPLEAIEPKQALGILASLDEKKAEIKDPTAWIKKAASKRAPDLDPTVRKTLGWYNKNGGLQQEISFDAVKGPLGAIDPKQALQILGQLEAKASEIKDPTGWITTAAGRAWERGMAAPPAVAWAPPSGAWGKGGGKAGGKGAGKAGGKAGGKGGGAWGGAAVDDKIKRTIGWYNKQGGVQQPIHFDEVAPLLAAVGTQHAGIILAQLGEKVAEISNPTGWICKAAQRRLNGGQ